MSEEGRVYMAWFVLIVGGMTGVAVVLSLWRMVHKMRGEPVDFPTHQD